MTQKKLALALGLSERTIATCAAKGMPTTSVAAARKWRETNLMPTQSRLGRRDGNPGTAAPAATSADLINEKVLNERAARQLRELELAQRQGQLINIAQLEPTLSAVFAAFRTELLSMADRIVEDVHAAHGIRIDNEMVEARVHSAMAQLAAFNVSELRHKSE